MELLIAISMIAGLAYWLDSMRAKEIATEAARRQCQKYLLEFLDDTVQLKKVRLRRNAYGQLGFFRQYRFEFTSTGLQRYSGEARLINKTLLGISLQPYQFE